MALKRVCDVTGESDEVEAGVPIQIGPHRWNLDLSPAGLKLILEMAEQFTSKGERLVTAGEDEDDPVDEDPPEDPEPVQLPELSDEERAQCRAWAQLRGGNTRRHKFPKPGDKGRLAAVVVEAWVVAGRPVVEP